MFNDSDDEVFPDFPKLKGEENAFDWFAKMKSFLIIHDLWECVDPDSSAATETEASKIDEAAKETHNAQVRRNERLARHYISKACEHHVVSLHLRDIWTGREAFKALLKAFRRQTPYRIYARFLNSRMEEGESHYSWAGRLCDTAEEYEWLGGKKIEEIQVITRFFNGLTADYQGLSKSVFRNQIACLKDDEEPKLSSCLTEIKILLSVEKLESLWADCGNNSAQATRPKFPPKDPDHKYLVCQRCAKIGHIAYDCRSEVEGFAKAKQLRTAQKRIEKMQERKMGPAIHF